MTTSLVTGCAGFLGSHVCDSLFDLGHHVVALDNLSGGTTENLRGHEGMLFYPWSITDSDKVDELFRTYNFDYVYHLAAYAAEGLSHFIRRFNYTNNVVGSMNLINAAVNHNVKCFVFTSSIAVYGSQQPPFIEDMTPKPEDPYGIAKYAVEMDLAAANRMFGLPYIIFRPHNVYGERQNITDPYRNVVGIFMRQVMQGKPCTIFGDGTQVRAFTHVRDVAPVIAKSVDFLPEASGGVFNVGSGVPSSVNFLAATVQREFGVNLPIQYQPERHEAKAAYCAPRHQIFGPGELHTSLEDGISLMARWVKSSNLHNRQPQEFSNIEITRNLPASWRKDGQ